MTTIDRKKLEEAINSWIDSMNAPSTITSYIYKFKGSLIDKLDSVLNSKDDKFLMEIDKIIYLWKKMKKGLYFCNKMGFKELEEFMDSLMNAKESM